MSFSGLPMRRRSLAPLLAAGMAPAAWAAAVQGPLQRPAIPLQAPERSVFLGLAQAGQRLVAVGERGVVVLSDDAGLHWRQAAVVPVSVTLTAVQFVSARTGWAVGHQGVVLRSDDGGEHWQMQLEGRALAHLLLAEAEKAGDPGRVAPMRQLVQEGADKPFLAMAFQNENEGLVVGAFNLALATRDGGRSWQGLGERLANPKGMHLYAVQRTGQDLLIAGEQGLLLHSADGGDHFERLSTPYGGSYFCLASPSDGSWWLAGLRGHVLRSVDRGQHWTELNNPLPVSLTAATRDSRGRLWLVNQAGQVLQPDAANTRLQVQTGSPAQQPASVMALADGSLLMAGWNGLTRVPAAPLNLVKN